MELKEVMAVKKSELYSLLLTLKVTELVEMTSLEMLMSTL